MMYICIHVYDLTQFMSGSDVDAATTVEYVVQCIIA
jgi:hypothetical protein